MIVTCDTTILVRATKRSNGPARKVVDAIASHPAHLIALSPFILGEVGKVLSYPRMQALFRLTAEDIHDHVEFLRSVSRIVEPQRGVPVVLSDPTTTRSSTLRLQLVPMCCASGIDTSVTRTSGRSVRGKISWSWMTLPSSD